MVQFDFSTLTGPLADFLVAELVANEAAVKQAIMTAETSAEAAIVKSLEAMPKPGGLLGVAFPVIKAGLEKYAAGLVTKYGPDVVLAFVEAEARMFAARVGG